MKTFLLLCLLSSPLCAQTYFAPEQDVQSVLLGVASGAQKEILVACYGLVDQPLTDLLVAKAKAGVSVKVCCDRVQAAGASDKVQLSQLRAAGIEVLVGTSAKHHIMHLKLLIVDEKVVFAGSYNLTLTAGLEDNYADVTSDAARTALFVSKWQRVHATFTSQPQGK